MSRPLTHRHEVCDSQQNPLQTPLSKTGEKGGFQDGDGRPSDRCQAPPVGAGAAVGIGAAAGAGAGAGAGAAAAGFSSTGTGTTFLTDSCHRANPSSIFFGAATVKPWLVAHCCISPANACSGTTITSSSSAANSCSASLAWGNR